MDVKCWADEHNTNTNWLPASLWQQAGRHFSPALGHSGQIPCRFLLPLLRRHDWQRCWAPAGAALHRGSPGGPAPLGIRREAPGKGEGRGRGAGEGGAAVLADAQTGLPMEGPAAGRGLSGPTSQTA